MKIKNLAFFGVMAAIMGVANAARADATTVIASQAYVDAKDDLKQNLLDSGANGNVTFTGDTTNGNVITNVSANGNGTITFTKGRIAASDYVSNTDTVDNETKDNVLEFNNASDKAPSVTAVKNMKTTSVAETGSTSNFKLPTETAVRAAITAAETTLNTTISNTSDAITGNFEDAHAAGANVTELDRILEGDPNATANVHNTVADTTDLQKIPRNYNIQKGIAYVKGAGIENRTAGMTIGGEEATDAQKQKSWATEEATRGLGKIRNAKALDDYVPTMAAVEARVKEAEQTAGSNLTSAADDTASASVSGTATTLTIATAGQAGNKTDKFATSHAVATGFTAVNTAIGNMALDAQTGAGVVKSVSQADGKIAVSRSTVATDDIANSAVTHAKLADDAVEGNNVKNHSLQYKDEMDFKLSEINTPGGDGSAGCVIGSPCVLTMVMSGGAPVYEWTNMDTDNTNAVLGPAS